MKSSQANFIIEIGNKSKVPTNSPPTTPSLSPDHNLYFIRSAYNSSSNVESIAQLIKSFFGSKFVYEDGDGLKASPPSRGNTITIACMR
jgi:hypothetical protein